MSNSNLVSYTKLSPNCSKPRNHKIDTITIHHMAGNLSVESCGEVFAPTSRQASSNYGIGTDGRVGLYVDEADRSWCSSSRDNDNRAITIEVANDEVGGNWHVSDKAFATLVDLCVDICQRNEIPILNYTGDKNGNLTMHKWFAATACPGPYLESRFADIAKLVNERLNGAGAEKPPTTENTPAQGTQASVFSGLSAEEAVKRAGALFTADQKKSGILASVSMAQFILESGYGKSELAQKANNFFGMKCSLSGNTWDGSTWDGQSKHTIQTQEQNLDESYVSITADFRKYACMEDSIADHSAYLLGAKKGSGLRYAGLKGCTDYKTAVQIIKDGGYATDLSYVSKLCSIIERWDLTQFDVKNSSVTKPVPFSPYLVRVKISDLNIRKGPGTHYARTGYYTGKGVFTIVAEHSGEGATLWGKLKSGAGWISLDYASKI